METKEEERLSDKILALDEPEAMSLIRLIAKNKLQTFKLARDLYKYMEQSKQYGTLYMKASERLIWLEEYVEIVDH